MPDKPIIGHAAFYPDPKSKHRILLADAGPTFHGPQFGTSDEKLRAAVNASCNCGGKPLGHGCCPACEVWHRLKP